MSAQVLQGLLLLIRAGGLSATFSVPMKFTRRWQWENIWGVGSLFALLVGLSTAFVALPDLPSIYRQAAASTLAATFLFGAGWGAGSILFGLGVHHLGVGLGVTLILSLNAVIGSVLPLIVRYPDRLFKPIGFALLLGLMIMLVGLGLVGLAGYLRDQKSAMATEVSSKTFARGLLFCLASGLLSPLANFAFVFGEPLKQEAALTHGGGFASSTAPWAAAFAGCFGLNVRYCAYLMVAKKCAVRLYDADTKLYWLGAPLLGACWVGAMILYGWGASQIGDWGPYLGYPTLMINSVVFANVWGAVLGEWRAAPPTAKRTRSLGLILLVVAFAVFGYASGHLSGT